jgi:hypothetical protein
MDYASERVPQVQVEEMKQRAAQAVLAFVAGEEHIADPEKRNVQRPRVFYRREVAPQPFVIARP